ncbi:DUF1538 domain-containing protein [Virgibacillus dakarensis]|uniref:DUF1538 domain-containing protein n=1 Tax=Lentibacillus populi TaxID=1827502 RepID=A0A9W5TYU3_9BACI|nr:MULTISPECIES: DUF1538 domain-containing protein [Bacillaceae]MBT2215751.1 DUF1538 family protein [Virgibacillus dakarensis]MTW86163.1 DUF1538 domain-containing protein [Virgibacillus dakarensis]GGB46618.1 hypothetical protein GCM10011409_25220 [Lentibacillus populi]
MNIHIFAGFSEIMLEVATALSPLFILFLLFQFVFLKLPMKKLRDIGVGFLLTFFGLSFFLQGVHIGFLPIGELMGKSLGALSYQWVLIPIGFILGFFAIYAEPAVTVLIRQVEKVSGGYIPQKILLYTLSVGVGISIALAMIRILFGISLWYFIVPGYIIALIMVKFSSKTFTSIAFDSGGVATGPMTATFILAMFVGIATQIEGRDPLLDGFGMVALVALAPILSVLTLGILYSRKEKGRYGNDKAGAKVNRHDR